MKIDRGRSSCQPEAVSLPNADMAASAEAFKGCCAATYEEESLRFLLGDVWHPGGGDLTDAMVRRAGLGPGDRVLDVACGRGQSALALSARFGCRVTGVDLSVKAVEEARRAAAAAGLAGLAIFETGDAELLPFAPASFDVVLCECALCTFPSKADAVSELVRVLCPNGRAVVADVTLEPGPLPLSLASWFGKALCIAGALPLAGYGELLVGAGFQIERMEDRRDDALDFLRQIDRRLLLLRIGQAFGKVALPGLDVREARRLLALARGLVEEGRLSYGYIIARRPPEEVGT